MVVVSHLEHGKKYIVNLDIFTTGLSLNYLVNSFKINYSGGAKPVNQKGRKIASAFKGQPTVTVELRLFMSEPDFAVVVNDSIINNRAIIVSIGKVKEDESFLSALSPTDGDVIDQSGKIFEIIGFIQDASIVANAGEFVIAELKILADDIADLDPTDLPRFEAVA